MNAFLGKCKIMLVVVSLFAFAKANSQTSSSIPTASTVSIQKTTTRAELLALINGLKSEGITARLIAYKRSEDVIKSLGLTLADSKGKTTSFTTDGDNGIPDVCIQVSAGNSFSFLGLCSENNVLKDVHSNSTTASTIKNSDDTVAAREQKIAGLREDARQANNQRLADIQQQKITAEATKLDLLATQQQAMVTDTESMKAQQIAVRAELKELENESNRIQRERKTLDYNNKRALAKRDSLQQQQERLQQKIVEENLALEASIAAQEKSRKIIDQQKKVIDEQELLAETAEGIKAYRNAMLGNPDEDELKKQGYLFFAAEQCMYKVYDGYTIIYDSLGKMIFSVNKELTGRIANGSLKIQGRPYTFLFKSNYLIIKNQSGKLVDQYGAALDGSLQDVVVEPFEKTHEFSVNSSTSPRDILAYQKNMEAIFITLDVLEENRDTTGKLTDLRLVIEGKEYEYHDPQGISPFTIEIDQPAARSRIASPR